MRSESVADPGGASGARPPKGPNSFISTYKFYKTYAHQVLAPPGKPWIRHCELIRLKNLTRQEVYYLHVPFRTLYTKQICYHYKP